MTPEPKTIELQAIELGARRVFSRVGFEVMSSTMRVRASERRGEELALQLFTYVTAGKPQDYTYRHPAGALSYALLWLFTLWGVGSFLRRKLGHRVQYVTVQLAGRIVFPDFPPPLGRSFVMYEWVAPPPKAPPA